MKSDGRLISGGSMTASTASHCFNIGFRNVIIRYPEQRFSIVLLTNRNDPEPYQTARAIGNLLLK